MVRTIDGVKPVLDEAKGALLSGSLNCRGKAIHDLIKLVEGMAEGMDVLGQIATSSQEAALKVINRDMISKEELDLAVGRAFDNYFSKKRSTLRWDTLTPDNKVKHKEIATMVLAHVGIKVVEHTVEVV